MQRVRLEEDQGLLNNVNIWHENLRSEEKEMREGVTQTEVVTKHFPSLMIIVPQVFKK